MLRGFPHQEPIPDSSAPKSAASPQHGQKSDELCKKLKERRSFAPRPER